MSVAPRPSVILVTDPRYEAVRVEAVVRVAGEILGPGALAVQLRDKVSPARAVLEQAKRLRAVTREASALLLINGSARVARDAGADGVHCPRPDELLRARDVLGDAAFLSVPAHDAAEVLRGVQLGAQAILVSPIYATPGKGPPRGEAALREARAIVDASAPVGSCRPLLHALGGVTPRHVPALLEAGADGVALIRALLDHEADVEETSLQAAVRELASALRRRG